MAAAGMRINGGPMATALMPQVTPAAHPAASAVAAGHPQSVERKVKRHARREQLYVAIRESMTRAGMLSASYKFKVLSLDQNGNQFLVMMDVAQELTTSAEKLSDTEEILIRTANAGYGIVVTAVYWRVDRKAAPKLASPTAMDAPAITQPPAKTANVVVDFAKTESDALPTDTIKRSDPLLEAEVAAFKRALAAAPAASIATAALIPPPSLTAAEAASKTSGVLKSYTLITGFEDTEMPDSPATPALSATQYGELN